MTPDNTVDTARLKSRWLVGLAVLSALDYVVLALLSRQFTGDVPAANRPTLMMLVLFAHQFVFYGCALWLALRLPATRRLLAVLVGAAVVFRAVLLPSVPMHEIDIYRYIWDGAVLAEGISPYHSTPQQVVDASNEPAGITDPTLQKLVELQARSGSLHACLHAIHFGHYSSPYPIVSQAVFAVAAKLTPDESTSSTRLLVMKSLLVLFDLGTLVVLMLLLRDVKMHPGWSIAYGWCPLVMKEVANGGHLDSIAIFLTTLAVWLLVRTRQPGSRRALVGIGITAATLALAIGAKLYPVVLVPLFAAVWLRRRGPLAAAVGLGMTALVAATLLYPLLRPTVDLGANSAAEADKADDGIQAFLQHWEMNDLIYMVVLENLRSQEESTPQTSPWFVVTSDAWSRAVVTRWATWKQRITDAEPSALPLTATQLRAESFSLARLITGGGFALLACWVAWRAAGQVDPRVWCRAAMLTLAWFWLTSPTQNPWYWCWVLPLLPFARCRTWLVVAAVTMLYYLRFWLSAHYADATVLGTSYNGEYFFYYVVAWVEFLPILLALAAESWWLRGTGRSSQG